MITAKSSTVPDEVCECEWMGDEEHPEVGTSGSVPCACGCGRDINLYRESAIHWDGLHWRPICAFRRLAADRDRLAAEAGALRAALAPFAAYADEVDKGGDADHVGQMIGHDGHGDMVSEGPTAGDFRAARAALAARPPADRTEEE